MCRVVEGQQDHRPLIAEQLPDCQVHQVRRYGCYLLKPVASSGLISIVNFQKRGAQELRRIILLHLGLVAIRFHLRKTRKSIIFMIF